MMDINLIPGISGTLEKIVERPDLATAYGSGTVEVFATPALIALMERTAMNSVQQLLPDGYTTVGAEVNVRHLKAVPVGSKVTCNSFLTAVESRKLIFEVTVSDAKGKVGSGTHTRFIVETKIFLEKLAQSI